MFGKWREDWASATGTATATASKTVVRKVKGQVPDLKDVQVVPAQGQQQPILTAPTPVAVKKRGAFWGKPLPE
jgi:hypothetical protein